MLRNDCNLLQIIMSAGISRPPARLGVPSLVRYRYCYTYGSEPSSGGRRNISPVKSLARPPRRTARLACASRCAPTETRAPLEIERTPITSTPRLPTITPLRSLVCCEPAHPLGLVSPTLNCHITPIVPCSPLCVCSLLCMCATDSNLCIGGIPRRIQDGRHHKAACEHSK
ncbi:jg11999 [Pararge aegeria aegeria]|uniref:Jg11999 protein n=1 Tax=Pararge aegeria aegeria TaxID=348720 RepID=A0A8S4R3V5_9NEOP|nr:jg11999 [Pararge aegeria aegeria]